MMSVYCAFVCVAALSITSVRSQGSQEARDIVFVVDSSDKVEAERGWDDIQQFLEDVISPLTLSTTGSGTRVGVVLYGDDVVLDPEHYISLDEFDSSRNVVEALDRLEHVGGRQSDLVRGLYYANRDVREHDASSSQRRTTLLIVLASTGPDDEDYYQGIIEDATRDGVLVLTVGLTEDFPEGQLRKIVQPSTMQTPQYWSLRHYEELAGIVEEVERAMGVRPTDQTQEQAEEGSSRGEQENSVSGEQGSPDRGDYPAVIDVLFILEASEHSSEDFSLMLDFVLQMVSALRHQRAEYRVALLTYHDSVNHVLWFNSEDNIQDVVEELRSSRLEGDGSIREALISARREYFTREHGDRPDADNLIILLATSASIDDPVREAGRVRDDDIRIIPIGITRTIDEAEISALASGRQREGVDYFVLRDATGLEDVGHIIINDITGRIPPDVRATSTARPTLQPDDDLIDIVIVLDASRYLRESGRENPSGQTNWDVVIRSLEELLDDITRSHYRQVRIGFIVFSDRVDVVTTLRDDPRDLSSLIRRLEPSDDSYVVETQQALRDMIDLYGSKSSSRRGARQLALLIHSADITEDLTRVADDARRQDISIYTIGLGDVVDPRTLEDLSHYSHQPTHTWYSEHYADMDHILNQVYRLWLYNEPVEDRTTTTTRRPQTRPTPSPDSRPTGNQQSIDKLLDLVIAIDSGSSELASSRTSWSYILRFLTNVLEQFTISRYYTQVGLMQCDSTPRSVFYMDHYHQYEPLREEILQLRLTSGTPYVGSAIRFSQVDQFVTDRGMRADAPNVLLIILSGPSDDMENALQEALVARQEDIAIIVVGTSRSVDQRFVQDLTGSSRDRVHYILVDEPRYLDEFVIELVQIINSISCPQKTARYGNEGLRGPTGDPGRRGRDGPRGEIGLPGPTGREGPTGHEGDDGEQGERGEQGLSGVDGRPGAKGSVGVPGPTGSPGHLGRRGPKGARGPRGPTGAGGRGVDGPTGPTGPEGPQGVEGIEGEDGDDGLAGLKGEKGERGYPGRNGRQGAPGSPGGTGPTGRRGDRGEDGSPGTRGEPGVPGRNGPTGQTGVPGQPGRNGLRGRQGEQGDTGAPGLGGDPGSPGFNGRTGDTGEPGLDGRSGTRGPTGEDGADGPTGRRGAKGTQGARGRLGYGGPKGQRGAPGPSGIPGTDGRDGEPGEPGEPGASGLRGVDGRPGRAGGPGEKGDIGPTGRAGRTGAKGSRGLTGEPGARGPDGERGLPGDRGLPGLTGDTGVQGRDGLPGPKGYPGPTGDDGPTGLRGPTGEPGDNLSGRRGADGEDGDPGDPGATGESGDQGRAGRTGRRGPTGDQGLPGERGPTGAEGAAGDDGVPGEPGPTGLDGLEGRSGEQGESGAPGPDGRRGNTGNPGMPGQRGATGERGAPGDKGVIGRSGMVGREGDQGQAGVTGTTGRKGEAGDIGRRGQRGPPGPTGSYGPAGADGRPGSAGRQGTRGLSGPTGQQGDTGEPGQAGLPGVTGDKGEQGPSGPKGYQGAEGPSGFRGIDGASGDPGDPGRVGRRGPAGYPGDTGAPGMDGVPGAQGRRGLDGRQGDTGPSGVPGPTGRRGSVGPTGEPGRSGLPGVKGEPGLRGPTGDDGDYGLPGLKGRRGSSGQDGEQGDTGPSGPPGEDGNTGEWGAPGVDGEDGRHGRRGPTGAPGDTGEPGPSGTDGVNGLPGPKGVRGREGLNGQPGRSGLPGLKGELGPTGLPGRRGDDGLRGPTGLPGLEGRAGPTGYPGRAGDKGDPGAQGNTGPVGYTGDWGDGGLPGRKGERGPTGDNLNGRRGSRGEPGEEGHTGDRGPTGEGGPTGREGPTGGLGRIGATGERGPTGVGRRGPTGLPGVTGPAGEDGLPGSQGPTGPTGERGPTGRAGADGADGPPGYSHGCVKRNLCFHNNGGCEHRCTNTYDSHYCSCSPGYTLDVTDDVTHICPSGCGSMVLDIVLLLDSSTQVGRNWPAIVDFVLDFAKQFRIGRTHTQMAVVLYGNTAHVEMKLDTHQNDQQLIDGLRDLRYRFMGGDRTNVENALNAMLDDILDEREGDRPDVDDVGILVTFGQSSRYDRDTIEAADRVHRRSVQMYVVALEEATDQDWVRQVSSYPHRRNENYHNAEVDLIDDTLIDLTRAMCPNTAQTYCRYTAEVHDYLCYCRYDACDVRPLNSTRCVDLDECQINNGGCEYTCTNTRGSHHCGCPPGLMLSSNGYSCEDINECVVYRDACERHDQCMNTYGSYKCLRDAFVTRSVNQPHVQHPASADTESAASSTDYQYSINTVVLMSVLGAVCGVMCVMIVALVVRRMRTRNHGNHQHACAETTRDADDDVMDYACSYIGDDDVSNMAAVDCSSTDTGLDTTSMSDESSAARPVISTKL